MDNYKLSEIILEALHWERDSELLFTWLDVALNYIVIIRVFLIIVY